MILVTCLTPTNFYLNSIKLIKKTKKMFLKNLQLDNLKKIKKKLEKL